MPRGPEGPVAVGVSAVGVVEGLGRFLGVARGPASPDGLASSGRDGGAGEK